VALRDLFGLPRAALASAVMFLAGAVVPVLGGIIMIFAPAPVLGFSVGFRHALPRMLAVVALTMGVIALTGGVLAAAAYGLSFGLAAAVMCYMLERRKPFEMVVLCAAAAMLIAGTLAAFTAAGSPAALAQALHNDLMTTMARGEKFYHRLGIDGGLSADTRAGIVDTALRLSPALAAVSAAFVILANLGLFWRLSGRQQRVGYMLFGDLARWSTPEWLIWALLVSGFGLFIPIAPLSTIALNCFICVAAIYFCQGLAIMAFYFKVLSMPPLARGLIYFVTGVQPVLAALVCVAGILDLWIDFRRLKPPSQEARNFGDFL
jgi:uncharacterized protein YybS (DUF2232 family)